MSRFPIIPEGLTPKEQAAWARAWNLHVAASKRQQQKAFDAFAAKLIEEKQK